MLAGGDGVAGKNTVVVMPLSEGPDITVIIVVVVPSLDCVLPDVVELAAVPGDGVFTTGIGVVGG